MDLCPAKFLYIIYVYLQSKTTQLFDAKDIFSHTKMDLDVILIYRKMDLAMDFTIKNKTTYFIQLIPLHMLCISNV